MQSNNTKKYNQGMMSLEILIAFAVLILGIGAATLMIFGNESGLIDAENRNQAILIARNTMEEVQSDARYDFNLLNPTSTIEMNGPVTFTKNLEVDQLDLFTKEASLTTTWQSGKKTLSVRLDTLFTNPEAVDGGNTCSSILSGDWKNPILTNFEFGKDLFSDATNIFPISGIDVYKGKMFVTLSNSASTTYPTFFIFDISNENLSPSLISSLDNDSSTKLGLNAVAATDKYAYVTNTKQSNFATCNASICGQLQVIDVSVNPPVVKKTFKIPGVTGTAGQAIGKSILYHNGLIYLGLTKTLSGPEFNIIDVTDPLNPVYKGGFSVGNAVNSIALKDNTAYIATPNSENLTILDVGTSSAPYRIGGYSPAGGSNGKSLSLVGNKLYLGRTFGTNELHILDTYNPNNPAVLAIKDVGTGNQTSINSILIRDYAAFMLTDSKFEAWNVSNPGIISPLTEHGIVSEFQTLPGPGVGLDCESNLIYAATLPASNKGFISIITAL